jgi:hypothetical protein
MLIGYVIAAKHIAIAGGFSHFHRAYSTRAKRTWMMVWLGLGDCTGYFLGCGLMINDSLLQTLLELGSFSALPIGGFVVVGQMIRQHQICEAF